MAMTPRLDLRQTQSLVMTPQLQQAIKLLQLSNLEVAAYVEAEIEQNPLLERDEVGSDSEPNGEAERPKAHVILLLPQPTPVASGGQGGAGPRGSVSAGG